MWADPTAQILAIVDHDKAFLESPEGGSGSIRTLEDLAWASTPRDLRSPDYASQKVTFKEVGGGWRLGGAVLGADWCPGGWVVGCHRSSSRRTRTPSSAPSSRLDVPPSPAGLLHKP